MSESTGEILSKPAELRARITSLIANSPPTILAKVAEISADKEINRRIDIIVSGMERFTESETVLDRIKPDHIVFDVEGKMVGQAAFTASKKGERDKAQRRVLALSTALEAALDKGDFKLLEEALKSGSKAD